MRLEVMRAKLRWHATVPFSYSFDTTMIIINISRGEETIIVASAFPHNDVIITDRMTYVRLPSHKGYTSLTGTIKVQFSEDSERIDRVVLAMSLVYD